MRGTMHADRVPDHRDRMHGRSYLPRGDGSTRYRMPGSAPPIAASSRGRPDFCDDGVRSADQKGRRFQSPGTRPILHQEEIMVRTFFVSLLLVLGVGLTSPLLAGRKERDKRAELEPQIKKLLAEAKKMCGCGFPVEVMWDTYPDTEQMSMAV